MSVYDDHSCLRAADLSLYLCSRHHSERVLVLVVRIVRVIELAKAQKTLLDLAMLFLSAPNHLYCVWGWYSTRSNTTRPSVLRC